MGDLGGRGALGIISNEYQELLFSKGSLLVFSKRFERL